MKLVAAVAAVAMLALAGCKSSGSHAGPAPSASASAHAAPSASAAPAGPVTYTGSYTATAGALFVPDGGEYKGFKYRGDTDAGALGEGKISFTVDPKTGELDGQLEGPLGPAKLAGVAADGGLSFHLAPQAGSDLAFKGTGTGTLDGGAAIGSIRASSWHANVLRAATFTAKAAAK